MSVSRHKVFISFHHADQYYKDQITQWKFFNYDKMKYEFVFDDYSVCDGEIDPDLKDETIRIKIRDEYIKDASVLILLCGEETKNRKHIDWEIHAAMFNTDKNPKLGILVVNLPTISQSQRVSNEEEKEIVIGNNWHNIYNRKEFEQSYQYMPSRIIDNFVKGVSISVVNWRNICNNMEGFMTLIDNAFTRKESLEYDNSAPLRKNNYSR